MKQAWLRVLIGAAIVPVFRWARQKRAEAAQLRIDAEIEAVKRAGFENLEEFERRVLESKPAKRRAGLARQRLRESFVDDAALKEEASKEIIAYLPRLPRSAKRMSNHLRVLLVVAYEREMLGGSPEMTAGHIGKWVVLNERWPEMARVLKLEPTRLRELEDITAVRELQAKLTESGIDEPASDELLRFLHMEPDLGELLPRLVHLEPATMADPTPEPRITEELTPSEPEDAALSTRR